MTSTTTHTTPTAEDPVNMTSRSRPFSLFFQNRWKQPLSTTSSSLSSTSNKPKSVRFQWDILSQFSCNIPSSPSPQSTSSSFFQSELSHYWNDIYEEEQVHVEYDDAKTEEASACIQC
jgi:hypothetical protein